MIARKVIIGFVAVLGFMLLGISIGYTHNNSAPNFECVTCHQGEIVPDMVVVQGVPKKYSPGKTYKITVVVNSKLESVGENKGGFAAEATVGELMVTDKKNTQLSDKIITHTQEGSALRKWTFAWKAPKDKVDASICVMAIAANGDYSTSGDKVGTSVCAITPAK
jgi:hypothetical protein